jgi:acyl-coenzyme A thioesterase PaaI-like protein
MEEVTQGCRKLYTEELCNLDSLPNFIRTIKSRRIRWVGQVAHMGGKRNVYKVLVGKHEGKITCKILGIEDVRV